MLGTYLYSMFLTPALLGLQPPLWERPLLTFGLFSKKMPMNPFASSVQTGTLKRVESRELILTLMVQLWARQSFNISFLTCKMMLLTKGNWRITWSPWEKVSLSVWDTILITAQFSSVAQSCLTLCDPMDCSTPSFPVYHQLPELAQTHVHWVGDAIQPSYLLLSPFPSAFNLSQHQGLFQWVSSSHQVTKLLEFQLQHQSLQSIFRIDFL